MTFTCIEFRVVSVFISSIHAFAGRFGSVGSGGCADGGGSITKYLTFQAFTLLLEQQQQSSETMLCDKIFHFPMTQVRVSPFDYFPAISMGSAEILLIFFSGSFSLLASKIPNKTLIITDCYCVLIAFLTAYAQMRIEVMILNNILGKYKTTQR